MMNDINWWTLIMTLYYVCLATALGDAMQKPWIENFMEEIFKISTFDNNFSHKFFYVSTNTRKSSTRHTYFKIALWHFFPGQKQLFNGLLYPKFRVWWSTDYSHPDGNKVCVIILWWSRGSCGDCLQTHNIINPSHERGRQLKDLLRSTQAWMWRRSGRDAIRQGCWPAFLKTEKLTPVPKTTHPRVLRT